MAPFLSVMYIPMWLLISGCMGYELSTHHFGSLPGSIVSVSDFVLRIASLLLIFVIVGVWVFYSCTYKCYCCLYVL